MKKYFIFSVLIVQYISTKAQNEIIHAGENLSDHFTYQFPAFTDGTVLFKNGTVSMAKMNFNTFLCKMQFIDPSGDTLVLSKLEEISSIRLNDRSFLYNNGYYEIITESDSIKLAVLRKINIDVVVTGAMGAHSHTANIHSFDSYINPSASKGLFVNEDLSVKKETSYSLMGAGGTIINASKSGFLKMFSSDKKNIENYLKSNKINFNNRDDLEKLFLFCIHSKGRMHDHSSSFER
ncbi:MAG: hypothetical protein JST75_06735 [Bacteroidetes bacterium]|nr:hypothetical protein [Bacteroidota bacterium]